jgi:hypothetical protein
VDANWAPVAFAAVIVIGVVGGSLGMMVLKELLPLLRTIAEQRGQPQPLGAQRADDLAQIEARLDRLEANDRALLESNEFMRRLLEERRPTP